MMPVAPVSVASVFAIVLLATTALRLWLARRQINHVGSHRASVPTAFADHISLAEHQKAADYSIAKSRLGMIELAVEAGFVTLLLFGGLLDAINQSLLGLLGDGYAHGLALFATFAVLSYILGLPFSLYRTFGIETRFGFNKTTPRLWLLDTLKGALLGTLIGGPLLLAVLWMMNALGAHWWLYVWLFWLVFNLLVLLIYPTFIAPLFNTFTPLQDAVLQERIETLLKRCGFTTSGLFVMDGSRRSGHGNAYFTGFGKTKRIVFFDTLLERLSPDEIEAVLAHELGHFHHRHVTKRIGLMAVASLTMLWMLGYLLEQTAFFAGLGVSQGGTAMGLLLFSLVLPVFLFPLAPLGAGLSRRHEFEADAYAAKQARAADLISALVKLYRDNASTLTPDPLHSLFHDSHPTASARIAHLSAR